MFREFFMKIYFMLIDFTRVFNHPSQLMLYVIQLMPWNLFYWSSKPKICFANVRLTDLKSCVSNLVLTGTLVKETYFTMEVKPSLGKPTFNFNDTLAKLGLATQTHKVQSCVIPYQQDTLSSGN